MWRSRAPLQEAPARVINELRSVSNELHISQSAYSAPKVCATYLELPAHVPSLARLQYCLRASRVIAESTNPSPFRCVTRQSHYVIREVFYSTGHRKSTISKYPVHQKSAPERGLSVPKLIRTGRRLQSGQEESVALEQSLQSIPRELDLQHQPKTKATATVS